MQFEWDEDKRAINIAKHGIDFDRARTIWERDVIDPYTQNWDRGEHGGIAIGAIHDQTGDRIIAVVYTRRDSRLRIISARAARDYEREAYDRKFGRSRSR